MQRACSICIAVQLIVFYINRILIEVISCLKVGSFGRIDYFCENQVAMLFKCIW